MKINKSFVKSKTMWAGLLTVLVPAIFPEAEQLVKENPTYVMGFVGFVFSFLRVKTDSAIVVKG